MVVVGMDGCRGGWIAVVWREDSLDVHFWPSVHELARVDDVEAIAIDIPIGLSDAGPRRCDALARRRLPGRSATVFNAPPRACLDHVDDYPGANARARQAGDQGLSRQSFGLLAKIREVDEFWPEAPGPIYEVHPELSFARLNGGVPLAP